jgi:hypothetical protein
MNAMRDDNEPLLLRKLRRLVATVDAVTGGEDRRRLLVIESELRAVRTDLDLRCAQLVQKMNSAGAQLGAASAYARCATLRRGASARNTTMD